MFKYEPRILSWARKRCAPKVGALRRDIEVHSEFEKCAVTLLVMSIFSSLLSASRARLRAPTFGVQTFVIQLRILGSRYYRLI